MQSVRVCLKSALFAAGLMLALHPANAASVENGKTAYVAVNRSEDSKGSIARVALP